MLLFIVFSFYLILILVLSGRYFFRRSQQKHIEHWKKSLAIEKHERVFHQVFHNANGFLLSQQARQKGDSLDYVYGEIKFLPFLALFSLAHPNEQTVFYDLGCGVGKAVFACAMVYPIYKSVGIEILPQLYFNACRHIDDLAKLPNYVEQSKKIEFILGDFLEVNLDEATIIFINSTSFFSPTWEKICARLEQLPQLQTVITTSKTLASKHFKVILQTQIEMSWGVVFAYIHARKKNKY
ncbi:class I SAM-dependent methyltransferase [Legionella saoudiensis]|uniref:hypothetical protein n=1 Tax=Legionella saoudiensis TaxID=1750561 RepID=UPI0007305E61|nr:hypothetical protein [Legionella saoudiensis]